MHDEDLVQQAPASAPAPEVAQDAHQDTRSSMALVDSGVLAKLSTKLKFLRDRRTEFTLAAPAERPGTGRRRASVTFETRDKKVLVDTFRALKMEGQAEVLRERLPEAMTMMGYRELNHAWLTGILHDVIGEEAVSSFLDFNEFNAVVQAYRRRHLEDLRREFNDHIADRDVESISVEEATSLLESIGYLMLPGIVRQLLTETEPANTVVEGVDLADYVYLRQVIQYRGGFTQAEADNLRETFNRWDDDGSETLSFLELKAALKWQGFVLSSERKETADINKMMDIVTSGLVWSSPDGINFEDYLQVMRKYRELEIGRARLMFREHSADGDAVDVQGAIHIMRELGYIAATTEVVRDWSAAVGLPDSTSFTLDELYMFFTKVRANEGFTKAELEEISRAFYFYDSNGSGAVDVVELGGVLRWLGYPITIEQQQELMDDVDMDGSGEADFDELLKIMRWYKEVEYRNLQRAYKEGDLDGSGTLDKKEVQHLLPSLGYLKLSKEQSNLIDRCFNRHSEIDFEECMRLVQRLRVMTREDFRSTHGYQGKELEKLRQEFNKAASMSAGGEITKREIIRLFEDYFPQNGGQTPEDRERAAELLKKVDANGDGRLNWFEFLHFMRMAQDRVEFDVVNLEQEAAARSGFSRTEVRDLRKAFKLCDTDNSKSLNVDEILAMLACVRPLTRSIKERVTEIFKAADKDHKGDVNFAEFLMVMRGVTDEGLYELTAPADVSHA